MRITVSGACSRAGKTALAESVLRALPQGHAVAVKFTTTEDVFERCPRGTPCVVCDIDVPFRLIEDRHLIREAGTDTDRLAAAGASRVLWAIAKASAARLAWDAVAARTRDAAVVVIEGSTVADLAAPDMLLFVAHPFLSVERWKATSAPLIGRADAVIVNRPLTESRTPSAEVMAAIARARPRREPIVADVTRPLLEWAPELHARLAAELHIGA